MLDILQVKGVQMYWMSCVPCVILGHQKTCWNLCLLSAHMHQTTMFSASSTFWAPARSEITWTLRTITDFDNEPEFKNTVQFAARRIGYLVMYLAAAALTQPLDYSHSNKITAYAPCEEMRCISHIFDPSLTLLITLFKSTWSMC